MYYFIHVYTIYYYYYTIIIIILLLSRQNETGWIKHGGIAA